MKIICTQENLKTGLLQVGRIISSSVSLPVLNNVLLKTENGMLKISSTNLEVAITSLIRCKVVEDGSVTVMCKTLTDLINNFPNKNINIETKNNEVSIETENYHTIIKTLPVEEFPIIPEIESQNILNLEARELKTAINQVVFAVSTNQTQAEISGVFLKVENNKLKLVATDRYRLAEKKIVSKDVVNFNQNIIIPHKTIIEISRIIGGQDGVVAVGLSENQVSFSFNNTQIISRLIDGEYPPYEQIIPTKFSTNIVVERHSLVSALRAGGVFSQNNNSVKLEYKNENQKIIMTTESGELGKSVVELDSAIEGESGVVVVNFHYLLDCLTNLDAANVVFKIINDSSPSLLTPQGDENYIYLVMPIKN